MHTGRPRLGPAWVTCGAALIVAWLGASAHAQDARPGPPVGSTTAKADAGGTGRLPDGLMSTLDTLGGSGAPEGAGATWFPTRPVRGQPTGLGLTDVFLGGSVPVRETATETIFGTATARSLSVRSNAVLPDDRVRLPAQLWDIQAGGLYVGQLGGGESWGVGGTVGSASDRPFHSGRELLVNGLAFYRSPSGDRDAWLYYVVSATNGQVGRNIPVPGVAYEFTRERLSGVVGFPFVTLNYTPADLVRAEFYYAPLTDLTAKLLVGPADGLRGYGGFAWVNQSWFRAGRANRDDLLFLYEKRLEAGVKWAARPRVHLQAGGGYAFDRYFVENTGFSLTGRNRVDVAPGPYVSVQLLAEY